MFQKALASFSDRSYAALRIVSGLMFSFHGMQKMFGLLTDQARPAFGSQMWFGGIIELVCGLAIATGFYTVPAAFLASGTMAVAYIQFHWDFQFNRGFFPDQNGGELALLYSFVFLYMACKGSGIWTLQGFLKKKGVGTATN